MKVEVHWSTFLAALGAALVLLFLYHLIVRTK